MNYIEGHPSDELKYNHRRRKVI